VTTDAATRNVEALRDLLDATERRDRQLLRAGSALVHPDYEWSPLISGVEGRVYRGHEGVGSFLEDLLGSFDVRYADRDLRAIGDRAVLLLCTLEMRGLQSGAGASQELGVLWEFEAGRIRRGRAYDSHAEALAAAEALDA
jgi:ketosteroid isomerase-like protein